MSEYDAQALRKKFTKEIVIALFESLQRKNVDFSKNPENGLPEKKDSEYDVKESLNIPYINYSEIPLAMDVFQPETEKNTKMPAVVVIHGGGLVVGDRRLSRNYARALARRGYVVFSIEYRLIPHATLDEEIEDISAGLKFVAERLEDFNADKDKMYMTCESAGAYLALYMTVMINAKIAKEKTGHYVPELSFKGLGLISGLIYTRCYDAVGVFFNEQYNSCLEKYPRIKEYADPEHPEVINKLPPVFLVTSNGDFLNKYTLMYHKALKDAGKPVKLKYYGSSELEHAFVTMRPGLPESQDAIDCMLNWFESQTQDEQKPL